ncbi:MAG: hypothetical protein Kow0037_00760 [Calditrichia bacterium]
MADGLLLDFVKAVGFPGIIFVIWYLYHRSVEKNWEADRKSDNEKWKQMFQQAEANANRQFQLFHEAVKNAAESQKEQTARTYEILKDLTETVQYHAAVLVRIESKIDNNQFCPVIKESFKK